LFRLSESPMLNRSAICRIGNVVSRLSRQTNRGGLALTEEPI